MPKYSRRCQSSARRCVCTPDHGRCCVVEGLRCGVFAANVAASEPLPQFRRWTHLRCSNAIVALSIRRLTKLLQEAIVVGAVWRDQTGKNRILSNEQSLSAIAAPTCCGLRALRTRRARRTSSGR